MSNPTWKISASVGALIGFMLFVLILIVITSIPEGYNNDRSVQNGMTFVLMEIPILPFTSLVKLTGINLQEMSKLFLVAFSYSLYGAIINTLVTRWVPFYRFFNRR